jgi:hypothetical protein
MPSIVNAGRYVIAPYPRIDRRQNPEASSPQREGPVGIVARYIKPAGDNPMSVYSKNNTRIRNGMMPCCENRVFETSTLGFSNLQRLTRNQEPWTRNQKLLMMLKQPPGVAAKDRFERFR